MPTTPPKQSVAATVRIRHATGQRHLAAGTGPQHEDADDLRHDP